LTHSTWKAPPMSTLTTAQRLAAYREELREAGFNETEVSEFVENAAPSLVEDVVVLADLDASIAVQ
jgi:hypothetical protein